MSAPAPRAAPSTTIKWLIDNGTEVKKGEKVIELDDSGLQEQLKDQNITVDNAKADLVKADEQYRIDEIQCQSNTEQAINARDLARLDLEKYIMGDFIQSLKDVLGRIQTAESDLADWKDRAAWSARMTKKGLMSKVQADADANRVDASRIALEKVQEERRVLVDYTKKRTVQDLTAKLAARPSRNLQKTKIQSEATLAKDDSARQTKKSIFDQQVTKKVEYAAEILKCTIKAPQDGLVVYYVPEQLRGGGGTQQSIVAQGEPVREGQKMMQIPDLTLMLVNVRVPEALVRNLHNEEDPTDKSTWQRAQVRVDAFSNHLLHGHIKTIDTVASTQDWFASDVKVYKTMITIDQSMEGLKPGMSAEVTISADESAAPVLVVPVQTVLGTISMGANRKCFVIGPDGQPEERDIVVGMSNERLVEVKSDLKEGDRIVLNPQPLLSEGSELKPGRDRSKSNDADSSGGEGDKKGGKKSSKKKGPNGPPAGRRASPGGVQVNRVGDAAALEVRPASRIAQAFEKMPTASPAERRDMLKQLIPDAAKRQQVRDGMRSKGLEVAD